MSVKIDTYNSIRNELDAAKVTLVAVSKTKPVEDITGLYQLGHRDFGENYVQEMVEKAAMLPADIRWHFIGHLQTNKVKLIVPFVQLIQGVDSLKLLKEINKQAEKVNRVVDCLLQVHIAQEETKFGLDENELNSIIKDPENSSMRHVRIRGLMGMASFSNNMGLVRSEFRNLKGIFDRLAKFQTINFTPVTLSMGMSSDYKIAVEEGSNMVRIGSLLFGNRVKK